MKKILIIIVLLCADIESKAHNAKIATFTLRDTGAGWFVEMNFAQAGVDAAMIEEHGKAKLERISKQAYQSMVVDYVKDNFHLNVDGNPVPLKSGGISLGSHQTDLKFVLPDLPLQPERAVVYIPMFGNTYNQTNLFRIYRGGKDMTKFFLSEDNDFRVSLKFTPQGIVATEEPKSSTTNLVMLSSSGVGLAILILLILSARRKSED